MAKAHLKLVTPATVKRTVTPRRLPNGNLRTREYLTEAEVERLMEAAKGNRYGHRDATMVLVAYRHGLRAPNWWTCGGIRWSSKRRPCTSAGSRKAPLARIRSSGTSYAPCGGSSANRSPNRPSCSPRSGVRHSRRLASPAWSNARALKPSWASRPTRTCCRHACGYALANKGHDTRALQAYLGHRNIQHTVRYTELSPTRFKDFWRE